mmetsp:Transcript_11442/g.27447  ORF Transcript_11442/g.27447 Transcript_11442/m.27447 type:complete len:98 (+) Transcript_11442:75-368(+)
MAESKQHMKLGTQEALKTMMRPHMHHAIDTWISQVGDTEKRGVLRLMRMAHPDGLHIDKPRLPSWIPTCATQKKDYSTLNSAGLSMMQKSASSPALR